MANNALEENYPTTPPNRSFNDWTQLEQQMLRRLEEEGYTKSEADALFAGKVDKVTGKGLSTNDFTNEDKAQIQTNKEAIDDNTEAISGLSESKADKSDVEEGLEGKVDKVEGKGLSANDFTDGYKTQISDNTNRIQDAEGNITTLTQSVAQNTQGITSLDETKADVSDLNNYIAKTDIQDDGAIELGPNGLRIKVDGQTIVIANGRLKCIVQGGGGLDKVEWGKIEGDIEDQDDLIAELKKKITYGADVPPTITTDLQHTIYVYTGPDTEEEPIYKEGHIYFSEEVEVEGVTQWKWVDITASQLKPLEDDIDDLHLNKVDKTTKVNSKPLSSDVTLSASDINTNNAKSVQHNLDRIDERIDDANTELAKKVDKVTGKGLSTNDYTNEDKSKVAEVDNKVNIVNNEPNSTYATRLALFEALKNSGELTKHFYGTFSTASENPHGTTGYQDRFIYIIECANVRSSDTVGYCRILGLNRDNNEVYVCYKDVSATTWSSWEKLVTSTEFEEATKITTITPHIVTPYSQAGSITVIKCGHVCMLFFNFKVTTDGVASGSILIDNLPASAGGGTWFYDGMGRGLYVIRNNDTSAKLTSEQALSAGNWVRGSLFYPCN